jgi:uncharacterized protein YggU (UPF0235/DUF167 family)
MPDRPALIRVKAHTHAKRDDCRAVGPQAYEVWVRAKPIQGAANQAIAEMLAQALGCPQHCLRLVRGAQARCKYFELTRLHLKQERGKN